MYNSREEIKKEIIRLADLGSAVLKGYKECPACLNALVDFFLTSKCDVATWAGFTEEGDN